LKSRIFHLVGTYIQLKRSQYPTHSEEFVITPFVTLFDVLFVYMMALKALLEEREAFRYCIFANF